MMQAVEPTSVTRDKVIPFNSGLAITNKQWPYQAYYPADLL